MYKNLFQTHENGLRSLKFVLKSNLHSCQTIYKTSVRKIYVKPNKPDWKLKVCLLSEFTRFPNN